MRMRIAVRGVSFVLLGGVLAGPAAIAGPTALEAQVTGPGPDGRWPLQPRSTGNRHLAPFMEGWYANEDGTFSISFGYLNANTDTIRIPLGPNNFIEPAQFDGMQPTTFFPGHQRGLFAVDLPAEMRDTDVWWTLRKENGEVTRVPGRIGAVAYQLDWYPRPHGTLPPLVSFDSQSEEGRGPPGLVAERTQTVSVGSALTLSISARDVSQRDPDDYRNSEGVALRVVWFKLQGPGRVEYTRHESNPLPEKDEDEEEDPRIAAAIAGGLSAAAAAAQFRRGPSGPQVIPLDEGRGTARVIATFTEPGEYLMRARVDNFGAADSGDGDQCCWTNGYVRVTVTP